MTEPPFGTGGPPLAGGSPAGGPGATPPGGPATPPGFGPPPAFGEPGPWADPLAARRDATRRRFLLVMGSLALLFAGSVVGLVMTYSGNVFDSAATLGDRGKVTVRPAERSLAPALPKAVPEPVTYRGSGNRTLRIRRPEPGQAVVYVKGSGGRGLFSVTGFDASGKGSGFVVATLGSYEGVRLLDVADVLRTVRLEIEAVGPWTVQVRSVRAAKAYAGSMTGTGDSVLRYTGPGGTARVRGGTGSSAFTVTTYDGRGFRNPVVISVGAYDAREAWPAGPVLVEVKATGRWSIRLR